MAMFADIELAPGGVIAWIRVRSVRRISQKGESC